MTLKVSTGLRNSILAAGSLKNALDNGFVNIYQGTPPLSADDAPSGTLLCTISNGGAGVTFDAAAANGAISKASGETWSGSVVANGTATYYRHVGSADTGVLSGTEPRIQGEIGLAGKELNLTDLTFSIGATKYIDYYVVALPTL